MNGSKRKQQTYHFPQTLRDLLDASELPWRLENGKKHGKLYVNGRFVQILPRRSKGDAACTTHDKNMMSAVRRYLRKARVEKVLYDKRKPG